MTVNRVSLQAVFIFSTPEIKKPGFSDLQGGVECKPYWLSAAVRKSLAY